MKKLIFPIFLLLLSCNKVLHVAEIQLHSEQANEAINPDAEILEMIAPYKEKLDAEMNVVIGESAINMVKDKPQSTLGNWMADLIHKESEMHYGKTIDFAIVNYGGIRIGELPKGPITRGKIFELMPFENMLVVLKVKGDIVLQLFDRMADYGGWPISRQVRYEINKGKAQNITIHGNPVDASKMYKIALSDFVANGGDKCFFFRGQPRDQLDVKFRDAIMEFIEASTAAGKLLDAEIDFRVRLIEN